MVNQRKIRTITCLFLGGNGTEVWTKNLTHSWQTLYILSQIPSFAPPLLLFFALVIFQIVLYKLFPASDWNLLTYGHVSESQTHTTMPSLFVKMGFHLIFASGGLEARSSQPPPPGITGREVTVPRLHGQTNYTNPVLNLMILGNRT
jgi:hypothetical protein